MRIRAAISTDAGTLAMLSGQLGYAADASAIAKRLDRIAARTTYLREGYAEKKRQAVFAKRL